MLIAEQIQKSIDSCLEVQEHFCVYGAEQKSTTTPRLETGFFLHQKSYVLLKKNSNNINKEFCEYMNTMLEQLSSTKGENIIIRFHIYKNKFFLGESRNIQPVAKLTKHVIKGLHEDDYFENHIRSTYLKIPELKIYLCSAIRIIPSQEHFILLKNNSANYKEESKHYWINDHYVIDFDSFNIRGQNESV